MKLYYFPGACPLVTHIVLEWIGKPYDTQRLTREETKEPAYLALNPEGLVPTLVDGDFVLTQSAAILEYLAELNPEADLLGNDPIGRAETRRWLSFCNSDIHRTFGLVFKAPLFTAGDEAAARAVSAKATEMLRSFFAIANDQLRGRDWLTGKRSVADPYLYVLLRWAHAKGVPVDDFAELTRFHARMERDPGVQAALAAQDLA
ncbi:glutathione S-transferase family protein [Castellaniella sp.]|uniref:glutathione S-transferase family protein n=1 Tax=Castellaniella sp. TaxID=1955812 RepID=UPI00355DD948